MMLYLKIIIFILINYTYAKASSFIGAYDEKLCIRTEPNTVLKCNHQLEPNIQNFVQCGVETVPPNKCFVYDVDKVFEPGELPFDLFVYRVGHNDKRQQLLRTLAINIKFPQPKWKEMNFLLRHRDMPNNKICREFRLDMEHPVNISNSIFWNCIVYSTDMFENNFYTIFLEDNNNAGGSYAFKIPSVNNYDIEQTNETRWHVFFFLHQHYMESTGKLFVTLQPAPFSNISYVVSLVKCLNESATCEPNAPLQSIFINQERYTEEHAASLTVQLKKMTMPGRYAVTVQILSPLCERGRCEFSMSPIFELKNSYTVLILLGLLAIMLVISLVTFCAMRKIHLNFYDYVEGKLKNMDTVLFVYHAETEEMFYLFQVLSKIFYDKFSVRSLMVDEQVTVKNPSVWTRRQLCNASKVLFFIPRDTDRDSATPIQHQWQCALTYFSGSFLKENQNIDSRCAAVLLPNSSPPTEGHELYSLRRFDLKRDLASLVNWMHRNSLVDSVLFWKPAARRVSKDLAPFIKFAVDPVTNCRPDLPIYLRREERPHRETKLSLVVIDGASSRKSDDSDSFDDFNLEAIDEKIRNEFDPLIPDIRRVRFVEDDNSNDADDDASQSSDSDDDVSVNDVTNFAT